MNSKKLKQKVTYKFIFGENYFSFISGLFIAISLSLLLDEKILLSIQSAVRLAGIIFLLISGFFSALISWLLNEIERKFVLPEIIANHIKIQPEILDELVDITTTYTRKSIVSRYEDQIFNRFILMITFAVIGLLTLIITYGN